MFLLIAFWSIIIRCFYCWLYKNSQVFTWSLRACFMNINSSTKLSSILYQKACCQIEQNMLCSTVMHCLSRSSILFLSVRLFTGLSPMNQFFNSCLFRLPLLNLSSGSWAFRVWSEVLFDSKVSEHQDSPALCESWMYSNLVCSWKMHECHAVRDTDDQTEAWDQRARPALLPGWAPDPPPMETL